MELALKIAAAAVAGAICAVAIRKQSPEIALVLGLTAAALVLSWAVGLLEDAAEFLLLGATTLQVTTSIMQYGYRIVEDMKNGLEHYMEEQGVDSLMDLIGVANANIIPAENLDRDYVLYPEFDTEKCIGCGRCYVSCYDGAHQAISWDEENRKPSCDHNKCVGCHLCALVCPVKAIGKGEIVMKPGRKGSPADKAV